MSCMSIQAMYLQKNLAYLMGLRNLNPNSLQELADIPQPTTRRILIGESTNPRQATLKTYADFFNVDSGDLLTKDLEAMERSPVANVTPVDFKIRKVPLISWVAAGVWKESDCNDEWSEVISIFDTGEKGYALRVEGESMLPRYQPNDIIFVNPDMEPSVGKRVVAACSDGTTFKEVAAGDGGKWILKALNDQWQPRYIPLDESCYIIGVVVGSVRPE